LGNFYQTKIMTEEQPFREASFGAVSSGVRAALANF
jgi:hypothetical protein